MKTTLLFSLLTLSLLLSAAASYGQSQTYNAGTGSGTGGIANVHVGNFAGRISTGNNNSFLGYAVGISNTTGSFNSFIGNTVGVSNTTGNYNTFMGSKAGLYNNGSNNSFVGNGAGFFNSTGNFNSFLGNEAGYRNTSGYNNSLIGVSAGYANLTGISNSYLGFEAGFTNQEGSFNSLVGYRAGYKTLGNRNVFLGYQAGYNNTSGNGNVALGYFAGPSTGTLNNAIAIGNRARVSTSNSLVLGSISSINGATTTIRVGIGTTAPGYLLHVNGTAAKPGSSSWTIASDKQLKKDIKDFTDGLETLEKIHPVTYRYNGKAGLPTEKQYVGVIAQEMQKIAPYTVGEFVYQDTTGTTEKYLDYDATALNYILVNAVKEQQIKIQALESELVQVALLKQELAQIKQLLLHQNPNAPLPSSAQLWQNEPNPYQETTTIRYYVPETVTTAQIKFYSSTGQEVHTVNLTKKGQGEITLNNRQFANGTYVYRLFIEGQSQESKRLVLVK